MTPLKAIVWGIALFALARGAVASPIRGNTPGTGVFQRSGVMAGMSVDQAAGGGAELLRLSSFAELRYTPSTHWVLALRAPLFVESRFEQPGAAAETASGPGDVLVSVKHRFYRWLGPWADRHAAVEVGLELPTGATDRQVGPQVPVPLRHRLQPGSGSVDGLIDVVYQQARERWGFHTDAGYRFNGEGDGFR
ncbi:MAG TPA: transporter, partial [Thermoanaerobaculia bacterium]|nr:transporter [Thermoanaerobaculia bacterium]